MFKEIERLFTKDTVFGVKDDEMVVLGKLNLYLVLLLEDGDVVLEGSLNDRPHREYFSLTETLVQ